MSRLLFVAAVVIAVAASASAQSCYCPSGIACYSSLETCSQTDPVTFNPEPSDNSFCGELPFYACLSNLGACIVTYNCSYPPPKCQCRHDIKCYNTLNDCRTYQGAVTPESGLNIDCVALGRPFYACWEEPDICRLSTNCTVARGGTGSQDPHFKGFEGSEYYFEGSAGQDFNIISDTSMQLNAHFIRLNQLKGTYMGRVGILFGASSVTFDPNFGAFYNETLMTNGEVETPEGSFLVETIDQRLRFVFQNSIYHIAVNVAVEKGEKEEAYLNIKASLLSIPERPHGILGQTARMTIPGADPLPNPFVIEGKEEDYHVRDGLLGKDFTFNRFVGHEEPVTVSASRFPRSAGAALFEASAH